MGRGRAGPAQAYALTRKRIHSPGQSLGGSGLLLSSPSLTQPSTLQSFNTYFSNEHNRLLLLWRQILGVRRLVSEVKMSTER